MYPSDLVPISLLTSKRVCASPVPTTINLESKNSPHLPSLAPNSPLMPRSSRTELNENSGIAILDYVFNGHSLLAEPNTTEDPLYRHNAPTPTDTFFALPTFQQKESSLLDRGKALLNLWPSSQNARAIDKGFLMHHGLTIEGLIKHCRVPIIDLWEAGIVLDYNDLCDLQFKPSDLTVARELFNVNHIMQFFKQNARTLELDIVQLAQCRFSPAELSALEFSLPDMIECKNDWKDSDGIRARHLKALGYSLRDLVTLGVTRLHLNKLGLYTAQEMREMGWDPHDVAAILRD